MKNFFQDFFKQLLFSIIAAIISFLVAYLDMWLKMQHNTGTDVLNLENVGMVGGSIRAVFGTTTLLKKYK